MLNSNNTQSAFSNSSNKGGILSFLSKNSKKIASILGFGAIVGTANVYNKSQVNVIEPKPIVTREVIVGGTREELNEKGFTVSKVTEKGISVGRFMKENGMEGDHKNLVSRNTGKRVINPNTDLIWGEYYIFASSDQIAKRLSYLIAKRNENKNIALKKQDEPNQVISAKIPDVSIKLNQVETKVAEPTVPTLSKQKSYIEERIVESIIPELDIKIAFIFQAGGENGGSKELLDTVAVVESSSARFLNTFEKAKNEKDIKKRVSYVELALNQIIAQSNDVGPFQITPGWLDTEVKNGFELKGNINRNLGDLKSRVRKVLINGVIKGLSRSELMNNLIKEDVRFDVVQMGKAVQYSFIRIYNNLGKYNLSAKDRLKLSLGAYNRGEGWAYKSAKNKTIGVSEDLSKRLKYIDALSNENDRKVASNDNNYDMYDEVLENARKDKNIVSQATLEVKRKIGNDILGSRHISWGAKTVIRNALRYDFDNLVSKINETKKASSIEVVESLNVFLGEYNQRVDDAIIKIATGGNQLNLRKAA